MSGRDLPERREVVEDPQTAAVRRDHEVAVPDRQIPDRRHRQVQAQRLPALAVVERHEHRVRVVPAKSRPRRNGSSRTALTSAPAGRPLAISTHVAPPSRVRRDAGAASSARLVLQRGVGRVPVEVRRLDRARSPRRARGRRRHVRHVAPLSRVTWIWPSSVPAQITRPSTYDGASVTIAPRDSSGLISVQVCPPVVVFQTELAPKSSVAGRCGAKISGGVADAAKARAARRARRPATGRTGDRSG